MNKHAQILGRLGGKAGRGKSKSRTTDQARAAAHARWGNVCVNSTGTFTCSVCGQDMRGKNGKCLAK